MTEHDLRLYKAALSKAANSLSYQRTMHLPQAVPGTEDTLYVIDLRRLGWDQGNLWLEVLKKYPYGLKFDYVQDENIQQIGKDRWVQSSKHESLNHFIVFGEDHFNYLISEYVEHDLTERPHQGLDNVLPIRDSTPGEVDEPSDNEILCRRRLGGLLKHDYRAAA